MSCLFQVFFFIITSIFFAQTWQFRNSPEGRQAVKKYELKEFTNLKILHVQTCTFYHLQHFPPEKKFFTSPQQPNICAKASALAISTSLNWGLQLPLTLLGSGCLWFPRKVTKFALIWVQPLFTSGTGQWPHHQHALQMSCHRVTPSSIVQWRRGEDAIGQSLGGGIWVGIGLAKVAGGLTQKEAKVVAQ